MNNEGKFLGIGWKFPPTFEKERGSVMLVSEEEDIKESLHILFSTKPGERVLSPDFGCDLQKRNFDVVDIALVNNIERAVKKAVLMYEPRITLEEIQVYEDDVELGKIWIDLTYTVRKTNSRSNMVYPYYILEGNNVKYKPI